LLNSRKTGFEAFYCEPGPEGAHEKGGVEGDLGRFRRRWLVPVPKVASLAELNAMLAEADAAEDGRRIAYRAATVGEDFTAEQRLLRPLPGERFDTSTTLWPRGTPHLVSTDGTGHCPLCGRAVKLRRDGTAVTHKTEDEHCPGSGQQPRDDAPLACWLPVRGGLTPHGLRHSHKTWMAEDGIPEILAEQRLGHDVPGMRGLYAHASQRMREELTAASQARWEESLRQRAGIDPHSPVPLLDSLLAPFRDDPRDLQTKRSIVMFGNRERLAVVDASSTGVSVSAS
jgi:hypothetical protein